MSTEIWRTIDGWPGYEVSNLGRVRGVRGWMLKGRVHSHGYIRVSLVKDGRRTDAYVHRLVLEAFVGPAPYGMEGDHQNRVRSDNRLENLRWTTPEVNKSQRVHPLGEAKVQAKLTEQQVRQIKSHPYRRGQDGRLAARFGVKRETVRDIRLGKQWRHVS